MQPGHIFPLQAVDGGVLMRAGHTEAGCDLAAMAGPDAGRRDLRDHEGRRHHGAPAGPAAVRRRARAEDRHHRRPDRLPQPQRIPDREARPRARWHTAYGEFIAHAWRDKPSQGLHLALVKGEWQPTQTKCRCACTSRCRCWTLLEVDRTMHSWSLDASLKHIAAERPRRRRAAQLRRERRAAAGAVRRHRRAVAAPERGRMDLRTYGVGAQILRECGVHRMNLMGTPAPHAQHGRLRPRGRRLHAPPERITKGHTNVWCRQGQRPAGWTAKAWSSASCRPASTRA